MIMNIGKTIRRFREKKGFSQGTLAKKARVSLNTIVKLELRENDNPTVKTLDSIARALGRSIHDLL